MPSSTSIVSNVQDVAMPRATLTAPQRPSPKGATSIGG
jgi:hypothetical protein